MEANLWMSHDEMMNTQKKKLTCKIGHVQALKLLKTIFPPKIESLLTLGSPGSPSSLDFPSVTSMLELFLTLSALGSPSSLDFPSVTSNLELFFNLVRSRIAFSADCPPITPI